MRLVEISDVNIHAAVAEATTPIPPDPGGPEVWCYPVYDGFGSAGNERRVPTRLLAYDDPFQLQLLGERAYGGIS